MKENNFLDLNYQREKLLKTIEDFDSQDRKRIIKALSLAEEEHGEQMRDTNVPYIIHPIRATLLLIEEAEVKKTNLICALLLHDVLEDTDIGSKTIKKELGKRVLELVQAVTRERSENETEKEKAKSKQKKIQKIAKSSKDVRLIKLCDRLDNKYSQEFLSEDHPSRQKFNRWNREFKQYLPIAKKTSKKLFKIFQALA